MKSRQWIPNENTTRRGWWALAYRLDSWVGPRCLKVKGTWRAAYIELSLFGLLGVSLDYGREIGFLLGAGVAWVGGAGVGWHPGVDLDQRRWS